MATVRCPGCNRVLIDFMAHEYHLTQQEEVCSWDRDYLAAEYLRLHPELMTWSSSPAKAPGCDTISDPTNNGANHV